MPTVIEKKKSGRPTKMPAPEVFAALYRTHTASEIAKKYGVAESTVRSWAHRWRRESEN